MIPDALTSALCAGGADFLGGLASRSGPSARIAAAAQLAGLPVAGVATAVIGVEALDGSAVAWSVGGGLAMAIGLACFYPAMARASIGIAATIAATVGAIAPLAYGIASGERVGAVAAVGLLAALFALATVAGAAPAPRRRARERARPAAAPRAVALQGAHAVAAHRSSLLLAAAAGVCFGLFTICLSRTPAAAGMAPIAIERAAAAAALVALSIARGRAGAAPDWRFAGAIAVLEVAGTVALLQALRTGPIGIVTVLAALYPVVTILLALVIAGERLSRLQCASVAAALLSVALISAG